MPPLCLLSRFRLLPVCVLFLLSALMHAQDFSIVVIPDTQNEAQYYPQVMNIQTNWIAQNSQALNIQMVLGVGDIVNDGAQTAQQQNADAAIRVLDNAAIPYMLAIGNHDYDNADPKSRSVTGFNQWFGPTRYSGKSYYKGRLSFRKQREFLWRTWD
jgi:Calcineurin-like phosphoesterase